MSCYDVVTNIDGYDLGFQENMAGQTILWGDVWKARGSKIVFSRTNRPRTLSIRVLLWHVPEYRNRRIHKG